MMKNSPSLLAMRISDVVALYLTAVVEELSIVSGFRRVFAVVI